MEGVGEGAGVGQDGGSGHETRPGLAQNVDERMERTGVKKVRARSWQGVSLIVTPCQSLVIIVS